VPLQLAARKKAGCKTNFKDDGLSGAATKRPALLRCLKKLEHGDTPAVWKFDRSGPSLRNLITLLDDLKYRALNSDRSRKRSTPRRRQESRAVAFVAIVPQQLARDSQTRVHHREPVRLNPPVLLDLLPVL
jgi:hypothetical protein